jgi:hypothetical protein
MTRRAAHNVHLNGNATARAARTFFLNLLRLLEANIILLLIRARAAHPEDLGYEEVNFI